MIRRGDYASVEEYLDALSWEAVLFGRDAGEAGDEGEYAAAIAEVRAKAGLPPALPAVGAER